MIKRKATKVEAMKVKVLVVGIRFYHQQYNVRLWGSITNFTAIIEIINQHGPQL
jgi:hypothetical protein